MNRLFIAFAPGLIVLLVSLNGCKEEPVDTGNDSLTCRDGPQESYTSCVNNPDTSLLDLVTWNLEDFPQKENTVTAVKSILASFHADVVAVQEITNPGEFLKLAEELDDWDAKVHKETSLNLGFLYNTCEITSASDLKVLNIGDHYSFPRKPVEMTVTHRNGLEVVLINVHLKCCNDGYERRMIASELLKAYIDENYPNDNVVLLGDFNDEIDDDTSPFSNFIDDNANFLFADMHIAKGAVDQYSYPGYPSHIDHILLSNELFDRIGTVSTVRFEPCFEGYSTTVSDHRPVSISLTFEE